MSTTPSSKCRVAEAGLFAGSSDLSEQWVRDSAGGSLQNRVWRVSRCSYGCQAVCWVSQFWFRMARGPRPCIWRGRRLPVSCTPTPAATGRWWCLLHGVLMNGSLWDTVVGGLGDRYRCIVPELPFGAHTTPMPDDADLSLPALATLIAEFLTELDLRHVTAGLQRLGRRATRHQPQRHRSCRQLGPGLL